MHEDYYKLIRVAGELTVALENSVHGNAVDLSSTLKSCINIYPDLFNQNVRDDSAEVRTIQKLKKKENKMEINCLVVSDKVDKIGDRNSSSRFN